MDDHLLEEVSTRLDADTGLDPDVRLLIDAALLNELDTVSDGGTARRPPAAPDRAKPPERVYVGSVSVVGFRGVGPEARLDLTPGPGLTLVVGRNGSGKSSFAEGLELLLTGDNQRWSKRTKEWQSGFRNVHVPDNVRLEAELLVEGSRASRARRSWKKDDGLDSGVFSLTINGTTYASTTAVGWDQPLQSFRPFLSYNEIGSILDRGPSTLFDTLNPILGLADLSNAADRLKSQQKELKARDQDVKEQLKILRANLAALDDERAKASGQALAGRQWKLDDVAAIVRQSAAGAGSVSTRLASLVQLSGPDLETVGFVAADLTDVLDRQRAAMKTDGERARRLMLLLEKAVAFHEHAGDGDCPVCGNASALNGTWSKKTAATLTTLRRETEAAAAIHRAVEPALARARSLIESPPPVLGETSDLDLDTTSVRSAWETWLALREAPRETLAGEFEGRALDLASAVEKLREVAEARHQVLERDWQALAEEIRTWLPAARRVMTSAEHVKNLGKAEKRLNEEIHAIRNKRFAPIKDRVFRFWKLLRARSSVDISDLVLVGTRTRRKVNIGVAVDGAKAAALGVMSQGELHALALSLFLPRVTMLDSPFGFLFIDDPVQAMDLARVDGLAQVLDEVSQTHQVVVFTHDDRLPGAVRRLRINARVLTVDRGQNSVVHVRPALDPVRQHLNDAVALTNTRELSTDVAARVIPGLCRQAIEAACTEVVRRRRLAKGEAHENVERLLADNNNLNRLLALVLMDDPDFVQEAKTKLAKRIHSRAKEIVGRCNRGAHHGWDGDFVDFVKDVEMVALKIQEIS